MLPITSSPRAFCFEDLDPGACEQVCLLEANECAAAWAAWGDTKARNLHELAINHWLNSAPWQNIGDWLSPYSGNIAPSFIDAIETASAWNAGQVLFLIPDRMNVITLPWGAFARCWRGLLCAFDDGPILVSADTGVGSAVCFAVLGQVQHTVRTE